MKPRARWLTVPLLTSALLCAAADDADGRLSQAELGRIEKGEVVVHYWKLEGSNVGTGKAYGLVHATPEQVFSVIADVNRYKDYIKRVVESRITRRRGKHYYFYYKINMPWPVSDYWFITKNSHQIDKQRQTYRRSWTLHKGSFARNDGYWQVRPWRGRALVTYSTVLQPKSAMPQFVINYATKKSLPRSIKNLRERVAWLKREGKLR